MSRGRVLHLDDVGAEQFHRYSRALDPLPTTLLKAVVDVITPFLTKLINRLLSAGLVTDVFK